jgi:site-specific recombinase XerD
MKTQALGPLVHTFFVDHLAIVKGLQPASIRSYRDGLRLFLCFAARDAGCKITRLTIEDLGFERVVAFLRYLEDERKNQARTRNQRLAILHAFFAFLATRVPEALATAERVERIPTKRTPPAQTHFLGRSDVEKILAAVPSRRRHAMRDQVLLLLLYNTGARAQEVAELRVQDVDLDPPYRIRLHGKGDKWRVCPLWPRTAEQLRSLLQDRGTESHPDDPLFRSQQGGPLTRFGIYKLVRRHAAALDCALPGPLPGRVSPHVFRHTTAMHLLEAGVEVNVIRGWLGHASLTTTHRYAEIGIRAKEKALAACSPPIEPNSAFPSKPVWRNDDALLAWLDSL